MTLPDTVVVCGWGDDFLYFGKSSAVIDWVMFHLLLRWLYYPICVFLLLNFINRTLPTNRHLLLDLLYFFSLLLYRLDLVDQDFICPLLLLVVELDRLGDLFQLSQLLLELMLLLHH